MRICVVDGCGKERRVKSRLYCGAHEHRAYRHGDPLGSGTRPAPARAEFERLAAIETDECVIWTKHTVKGYGYLQVNGKDIGVHVLVCERHHGPAPSPAHEVAHSCVQQRDCMNYRHVRWATRAENIDDKVPHGTDNRGERAYNHKLTATDVRRARILAEDGHTYIAIARTFGVHWQTIRDAVVGRTWAWLDPEEQAA